MRRDIIRNTALISRLPSGNKNVNSPYSGHVTTLSDSSTVVHQSIHPRISRVRWKKIALRRVSADLRAARRTIRGRGASIFIVTDGRNNFNCHRAPLSSVVTDVHDTSVAHARVSQCLPYSRSHGTYRGDNDEQDRRIDFVWHYLRAPRVATPCRVLSKADTTGALLHATVSTTHTHVSRIVSHSQCPVEKRVHLIESAFS